MDGEGSSMKETSEEIAARVQANLPSYLRQTSEQVEADKKAQELRRASFTRSKLTEEERLISRGIQIEEIARANIETMESKRAEGENISTRGGANLEMLEFEKIRLCRALELQGCYEEAASLHPLKREQKRLLKIVEAIKKDDSRVCACPPTKATLDSAEIEVQPYYEVKKIYSREHGKVISLVGCVKCGFQNATPNPPEQLSRILGAQNASHQAVKMNMRTAIRETDVLR